MEPMRFNYSNNNQPSGGGKNMIWIIIVAVVLLFIIFGNSGDEYDYEYEENSLNENIDFVEDDSDETNMDSKGLLSLLLFGDGSHSTYETESTTPVTNKSTDTYTLMIYMCGSDLESKGGYASYDIEEMLKASLSDKVNVLIYTGGARKWFGYGISNRTNQIYKIENKKLKLVKNNLGIQDMTSPNTLLEFIRFSTSNFPADKYSLIFWDHGGGAVSGFGLDEHSTDEASLTIDEIKSALTNSKTKFEFVGFDACLMANAETAYAIKDNANYMIASEETEPGTGWSYAKLLNGLSQDSSQTGDVTGVNIIDSFIASNSGYRDPDATLSLVDLSKMNNVYDKLLAFMKEIKTTSFDKNKYNAFSKVIAKTKAFSEGDIDTIDLVDFANQINNKSSLNLVNAVNEAVIYNKTNKYVQNANGLSINIPYRKLEDFSIMQSIFKKIGIGEEYINILKQYVNIMAGGRKPSYSVNNYTYTQDSTDYSIFDWFDLSFISRNAKYYDQTAVKPEQLNIKDKGDYFALQLSNKDWQNITNVESVVWYDDGKGYIDMGYDSYYEMDTKGDLKVSFDGQWIAINGDNIRYEVLERTDDYEKGRSPCIINGERVYLILYFDKEAPDGVVLGYIPDYEYLGQSLYERGIRRLRKGDKVDFVTSYYTYDGEFKDEYYINDTLVIGDDDLVVSYESLGDGECLIYYRLTDVYNNIYYTEPIILE